MRDDIFEAGQEPDDMGREPGDVNIAKILALLALVAFGSIIVLWLSYGSFNRALEVELGIPLSWLPLMLIPLWLLFTLSAVLEVRRARKESATATPIPPMAHAEAANNEPASPTEEGTP